jgi:hypothetical protein
VKLIRSATLLLVCLSMVGCNGIPRPSLLTDPDDGYFRVYSGLPIPYLYVGSAVQWNDEYAVTVSHMPFISGTVYKCSTGCDLKFFKHPANGKLPKWRPAVPGEQVTALGTSPLLFSVKGYGHASPLSFQNVNETGGELYAIHDAPVVKGMSGGPVYGQDGAVLGINIGFFSTTLNAGNASIASCDRVSIYVRYQTIEREWQRHLLTLQKPKYGSSVTAYLNQP